VSLWALRQLLPFVKIGLVDPTNLSLADMLRRATLETGVKLPDLNHQESKQCCTSLNGMPENSYPLNDQILRSIGHLVG
jgi:hypothetical protein